MAPLRRRSSGAITPTIWWRHYADDEMAPMRRRFTGGIGYYHVSDMYIALFSHFIPCGVYEAIFILDGLIKNESDWIWIDFFRR